VPTLHLLFVLNHRGDSDVVANGGHCLREIKHIAQYWVKVNKQGKTDMRQKRERYPLNTMAEVPHPVSRQFLAQEF
jgi:hypothetical protein